MKRLLVKLLLLLGVIFLLQSLLIHFFPFPIPPEVKKMNTYLKQKKDILYFGDSILEEIGWEDTDKRNLPKMLADKLPKISVAAMEHPADQPDVFKEYCGYILKNNYHPK